MTDKQTTRLNYIAARVPKRAKLYERCFSGKASLAIRIKTFCIDCMGVNMRLAKSCDVDVCPLWGGRPTKWAGGRPKSKRGQQGPASDAQLAARNRFKTVGKRSQKRSEASVAMPTATQPDEF